MTAHALPLLPRPAAVLDRHAARRATGVPTVTVLIGPPTAGRRAWRAAVPAVVAAPDAAFPWAAWHAAAGDWRAVSLRSLAVRAGRDADEFAAAWPHKTAADHDQFWSRLPPQPDDDLLRQLADGHLIAGPRAAGVLFALADDTATWPGVLFTAASQGELEAVAATAAGIAVRFPRLPVAVAVLPEVWAGYLAAAPDVRAKTILREGAWAVPVPDAAAIEAQLVGLPDPAAAADVLAGLGADAALVAAAAEVVRATTQDDPDPTAARSAAELFLFEFLESLPATAGRFELNGTLDFRFGPRPAEVDLLCRGPKLAVEIDGYFHFRDAAAYRRDRTKDFELLRRGYFVLRFLAEDVVPRLDTIRDRILTALSPGDSP